MSLNSSRVALYRRKVFGHTVSAKKERSLEAKDSTWDVANLIRSGYDLKLRPAVGNL